MDLNQRQFETAKILVCRSIPVRCRETGREYWFVSINKKHGRADPPGRWLCGLATAIADNPGNVAKRLNISYFPMPLRTFSRIVNYFFFTGGIGQWTEWQGLILPLSIRPTRNFPGGAVCIDSNGDLSRDPYFLTWQAKTQASFERSIQRMLNSN